MFKKEALNSEFIVQCKRKCFSSSIHLLEVLQEQIEHYCVLGNTVVIGDYYEHAHDEWSIRDLLHWQNYPSLPITFPCFESRGV
jgi:hypothetical protein